MAPSIPTLQNAWISGFTDAEGTFNVSLIVRAASANGFRVIIRFLLDQKNAFDVLMGIRELFGFGQVTLRKETTAVYRYSNDSLIGLASVREYFQAFPLKTKKGESFFKWGEVYEMLLNKEHLTADGLIRIRFIAKSINLVTSTFTKIGSGRS